MSSLTRRLRWLLPALVAVAWLGAAGPLNVVGSRLTGLQENDNAASCPTALSRPGSPSWSGNSRPSRPSPC
jgi:putative drug exporter of the RND superfamily